MQKDGLIALYVSYREQNRPGYRRREGRQLVWHLLSRNNKGKTTENGAAKWYEREIDTGF